VANERRRTIWPPSEEDERDRTVIDMMMAKRSSVMKGTLIAGAVALALSASSAFAQSASLNATEAVPATGQAPAMTYGTSGYVFPDDGSPSGVEVTPVVPQAPTQHAGHLGLSRIYLYPPSEGSDSGGGGGG
jgi:hypothetical protein